MPPEDADKNRGHKFPFLASEIFNCELNTVLEKFFEAPKPVETEKSTDDKTTEDGLTEKTDDGEQVKMVESLDPDKDLEEFLDEEKKDESSDDQGSTDDDKEKSSDASDDSKDTADKSADS